MWFFYGLNNPCSGNYVSKYAALSRVNKGSLIELKWVKQEIKHIHYWFITENLKKPKFVRNVIVGEL